MHAVMELHNHPGRTMHPSCSGRGKAQVMTHKSGGYDAARAIPGSHSTLHNMLSVITLISKMRRN